ncbi:MAG: KamA family radical SAM protein [Bdellovibrio sp.]
MQFHPAPRPTDISSQDWTTWSWQLRHSLKSAEDFQKSFQLTKNEQEALEKGRDLFRFRTTPYYRSLLTDYSEDPLRKILVPHRDELSLGAQAMLDPLAEKKNSPTPRIVHRYPDRALFLVTDFCSVYCRYCTRKHFTGQEQAFPKEDDYQKALNYLRSRPGLREVILSGGDPLTLSDSQIERVLKDLRAIEHIEIIRIGSRMPVVCPMRITENLVQILKRNKPVFLMTHFNHPRELTLEAAAALELCVDNGIPVFNQMVLLNGVNNHPAIVQALSRRLLYLRAKPYYMFQCDPSEGTDHLRTSIDESLDIQNQLWGVLSGLAMPQLAIDIPNGGGKAGLVPQFEVSQNSKGREYQGWDGVRAQYLNPDLVQKKLPMDWELYQGEWELTKQAKNSPV